MYGYPLFVQWRLAIDFPQRPQILVGRIQMTLWFVDDEQLIPSGYMTQEEIQVRETTRG